MTKGEKFYQDMLEYLAKGDIDSMVSDCYHDDAEMVTFEFVLKGKEAIRQYLKVDEPSQMGKVLGMTTDYFTASDDVIIFKASVKSEKMGTIKADDALYLKDGKILRHIALTIPPEKNKEWAFKEI
jgi:hypothetical protein